MSTTNLHPLFVVEGIDASGKASVVNHVAEALGAATMSFPDYSSPTGQAILAHLRGDWTAIVGAHVTEGEHQNDQTRISAAFKPGGMMLNPLVRQSLMIANRCEAQDAMRTTLRERPLILDRYTLSGLVYGEAEGLQSSFLQRLTAPLLVPQLTIVLDMPIELVAQRRPQARDLNERNLALLRCARTGYRAAAGLWLDEDTAPRLSDEVQYAHYEPGFGDITAVDASQPLADVQAQCLRIFRLNLLAGGQPPRTSSS